jgi:putative toxin-antitoxin system antitoxin component (TIGR02293 family)
MVQASEIAQVMGGKPVFRVNLTSVGDLERAIASGLPKAALRHTAERIFCGTTQNERGETRRLIYRVVPEATFKRRTRLSPAEGEKTERLARVIAEAEYVWADRQQARVWLTRPHPELGDRTPVDCTSTELGARQVEEVLARLFYGLPS